MPVLPERESAWAPGEHAGAVSMIRRAAKTFVVFVAVALAAAAASASPAAAKSKPACWKLLINDWYDGRITGKYDIGCYREAMRQVGRGDLRNYSSAYDDINRALQQRLAELAAAKKHGGVASARKNRGDGSYGSGTSSPPPPGPDTQTSKHQTRSKDTNSPRAGGPQSTPGRNAKGAAGDLIQALGPKDATSLPTPLIVLAGIGLLLMAVGAATLLAKRAQSRRAVALVRHSPPAQQSH